MLFHGGPVSTEGALAVGAAARPRRRAGRLPRRSTGTLGLVDLDTPVELVDGSLDGLRIFAGYAGWGAEQLVGEIEEGSWYVVPGAGRPTSSATTRPSCGATCCAASPASWRGTPPVRSTPT